MYEFIIQKWIKYLLLVPIFTIYYYCFVYLGLPKIKNDHPVHIDQNVSKDEIVFDCDSTAYPLVYNIWLKDTNELSGQNSKRLNISGHLMANNGIYQCISYNDIGASMKLIYLTLGSTGITLYFDWKLFFR